MSGAHIVENTNNEKIEKPNISNPTASTPPNNEEPLKSVEDLTDRFKKLEYKLEDLEPLIKISRCIGCFFRKSSNDTQENSKDAQGREEALKAQEENTGLNRERNDLAREKDNLTKANTELTEKIKL
ncbi:hypothetical protein [Helicobacter pylori]|uniref:hypothetical protein n=1 Tax=Helicobacter pylori TaxID=210 RepID=UPI001EE7A3A4|nr:hypothetical protein [Helicobacter pylori]